jgi:N-acetylglucosamine malate deacetylase 1
LTGSALSAVAVLRRWGLSENGASKNFQSADPAIALPDYRDRKGNILVISPHPDDDVLGAGGTMALAAGEGRGVFSVYVTDGSGSPRKEPGISNEEMAVRREKEALHSLKAIGAAGGFFLRRKSQETTAAQGREIQGEISEIVEILKPAEVYLPGPYERHKTHQACTFLAIEALRQTAGCSASVFGYSLWGSFWGEKRRLARDISSVIRKKVEAVVAHASQIDSRNYHQGILGKNNYEAVFAESQETQKASFVETFCDMTELLIRKDLSIQDWIRMDFEDFLNGYRIDPKGFE